MSRLEWRGFLIGKINDSGLCSLRRRVASQPDRDTRRHLVQSKHVIIGAGFVFAQVVDFCSRGSRELLGRQNEEWHLVSHVPYRAGYLLVRFHLNLDFRVLVAEEFLSCADARKRKLQEHGGALL